MEYFDNTKPNVIIFADYSDVLSMVKTLGPYKVASELRLAGFEVAVLHHISVFSIDEIKHILKHTVSDKTLFVGVNNFFYSDLSKKTIRSDGSIELGIIEPGSVLPHGKTYNNEIKDFIKDLNPACKLVVGGPTALDQSHNSIFDYVVIGYAEKSVVNLAQHLLDRNTELNKSYKSIYGPVIINDSKADGYDFTSSTPVYKDYDGVLPNDLLTLEIGRGCIFKCTFCSYPLNGKKKLDFIKHQDLIRQELLDNYNRFGVKKYIFCDDTFNDSPEKCKMIYDISKSLPFKLEWWAYIRLDLLRAHPETIDWIFESGCKAAFFGIETLYPKTAKAIGKGGNRDQLFKVIRQIKDKYGDSVSLHASFICGLPYEPMDSIMDTANFLLSDDNPLDSWGLQPLNIKPPSKTISMDFLSELDRNYEQYGYENTGFQEVTGGSYSRVRHPTGEMLWKNEHTDYLTVKQLSLDVRDKQIAKNRDYVSGNGAFGLSSLGFDTSYFLNKTVQEVDWHGVDHVKMARVYEYKERIFQGLKIPQMTNNPRLDIATFTQWLKLD